MKWADLEGTQEAAAPKENIRPAPATAFLPVYPTSSKSGPKDWDKLADELTKKKKDKGKEKEGEAAQEDDEEDSEGEGDAVGDFFKQLYGSADDDTKRAMMKSYTESNGTALSTDWKEVKKGKVETSPPGMIALSVCLASLLILLRSWYGCQTMGRVIFLLQLQG